ncbi:MAG: Xaa-Pro peptidase family protein [Spirochaetes bacterium]|jgi:Xaa-Pro aminopeptidase|nr:Xaa-Pro peptidase family protein [Spirochaetota bacterium]
MRQIDRLRKILDSAGLFPYLLFDLKNILYLTGFKGSSGYLLVDRDNAWFITDSRYEEYARSLLNDSGIEFILQNRTFIDEVINLSDQMRWKTIYVEDHSVTLENYNLLSDSLNPDIIGAGNVCRDLRVVKDDREIELLQKAAKLTDDCFEHLCTYIRPGITEWDVAVELEHFYRTHGSTGSSFSPIVASGANSSMPHYETSMQKKIAPGDTLLIDMGCIYEGYNSDLTRTVFLGNVNEKMQQIYSIVNQARQLAIDSVATGVTTGTLDSIARKVISGGGYNDYFNHSLGHGVGLDVHEHPRVKGEDDFVLPANSVITIEPGIYIPGLGGVRIEDLVQVTDNGPVVLSRSSREIRIL